MSAPSTSPSPLKSPVHGTVWNELLPADSVKKTQVRIINTAVHIEVSRALIRGNLGECAASHPDGAGPPLGTDIAVFIPDLDPFTQTNPLSADSDGDNIPDGKEDPNYNGTEDPCELDPSQKTTSVSLDHDNDGDVDGLDLAYAAQNLNVSIEFPCINPLTIFFGKSDFPADPDNDGILGSVNGGNFTLSWTEPDGTFMEVSGIISGDTINGAFPGGTWRTLKRTAMPQCITSVDVRTHQQDNGFYNLFIVLNSINSATISDVVVTGPNIDITVQGHDIYNYVVRLTAPHTDGDSFTIQVNKKDSSFEEFNYTISSINTTFVYITDPVDGANHNTDIILAG